MESLPTRCALELLSVLLMSVELFRESSGGINVSRRRRHHIQVAVARVLMGQQWFSRVTGKGLQQNEIKLQYFFIQTAQAVINVKELSTRLFGRQMSVVTKGKPEMLSGFGLFFLGH